MRERVVDCDRAPSRGGNHTELLQTEKARQSIEIGRGDPGVTLLDRIGINVAAARIADDPVASFGERRLLIAPDQSAAGGWMQQHHSWSVPARVPIPEVRIRDGGQSLVRGRLRG